LRETKTMADARAVDEQRVEKPCIWVLAGVLNYRLCDREYDCEGCELFHALRGDAPAAWQHPSPVVPVFAGRSAYAAEANVRAHLSRLLDGCSLYLDRLYCPPHFWLLERDDGEVDIGLDPALLRVLRPIRRIVTPGEGLSLERGQPCGWVARERMAVPLRMPFAGEISATNPDATEPGAWLFRARPAEPLDEIPEIVRGEAVLSWYMDRIRIFREYLAAALSPEPDLGALMADGGEPQVCLEDVLGRKSYQALVTAITHA